MGTTAFRRRYRLALALAVGLAAAGSAAAGSFSLAPIRVELGKGRVPAVLTLHNDSEAPVTIQVETVAWTQPEDADRYEATRNLIVTPPVFVVPPKGDQIVRVARRDSADAGGEVAYRLFFQEVPDSTPQSGTGLRIALRIGIPVFVAAPGAAPELHFAAQPTADGAIAITATNRGRAHVQITDFEVTGDGGTPVGAVNGSRYLLPGASARWTLTPTGPTPTGVLRIRGHGDRGAIAADLDLAAR